MRAGILALLEPIRSQAAIVLERGCGSGLLTRELTAAGLRVLATDASPAMLDLARGYAPDAEDIRTLVRPHDRLPLADAVSSAAGRNLTFVRPPRDVRLLHRGLARAGWDIGSASSEEVIEMFTRHSHKPHHVLHHLREWLHRCNPYA